MAGTFKEAFYNTLNRRIAPADFFGAAGAIVRSDADIAISVGTGGDYATLNEALEFLSGFIPRYNLSGFSAVITQKTGFDMAEQVAIVGHNFGWVTVVSEDAEVTIIRSALTTSANAFDWSTDANLPNRKAAWFGYHGAVLPRIATLYNMDSSGPDANYVGILLHGSHATIMDGAGVKNVIKGTGTDGRGINATHGSTVTGWGAIWDGCQIGMRISNASKANFRVCSAVGCQIALDINGSTEVAIQDSDLSGAVGTSNVHAIWASGAAKVKASGCDLTGCGSGGTTSTDYVAVLAQEGAVIEIVGCDVSNGQRGIEADSGGLVIWTDGICTSMAGQVVQAKEGGRVLMADASVTGCLSEGAVACFSGGEIIAPRASITNNSVSGVYCDGGTVRVEGATITGNDLTGANRDIRIQNNGTVYAYGAETTNGSGTIKMSDTSLSQPNTISEAGVLYCELQMPLSPLANSMLLGGL